MKKVAILQSAYIPWKGYFHIIKNVDVFVFLDNVQYSNCDWRNRNRIKTASGNIWLTIPNDESQSKQIEDVVIDYSSGWNEKHYRSLLHSYGKSVFFEDYHSFIRTFLLDRIFEKLSDLNQFIIKEISKMLGISTEFRNASEFDIQKGKNEKIISIVKQLDGNYYLSGPAAENYINLKMFKENGIYLEYMNYSDYLDYKQLWGEFCHFVSILDLLFCTGPEAPYYIWGKEK